MLQSEHPPTDVHSLSSVTLHQVAHARAGDKGERLNIALFAYHPDHYPALMEQLSK